MTWRQTKCERVCVCVRENGDTEYLPVKTEAAAVIFLQQPQATEKAVKILSPFL